MTFPFPARLGLAAVLASVLALGGCGGAGTVSRPDLSEQVKRWYTEHASEQGGSCGLVRMDTITEVTPIRETEQELVARVRYHFQKFTPEDIQTAFCNGFRERDFTFAKRGGQLVLTGMSGEQR